MRGGRGLRGIDAHLGAIRTGGVRHLDGRSRRVDRRAARSLDPTHAVRGRPRCTDAGPRVPDVHGVRAERGRPVAQHRRVHQARRHRGGCQRAAAGRARPSDGLGTQNAEGRRLVRRRPSKVVRLIYRWIESSMNWFVTTSSGVTPSFGGLSCAVYTGTALLMRSATRAVSNLPITPSAPLATNPSVLIVFTA